MLAWAMEMVRERAVAGAPPRDAAATLIAGLGEGHGRVAAAAAGLLGTLGDTAVLVHGASGAFQAEAAVYARAGQPCGRCGSMLRRLMQAQRSTYFCPNCQRR